MIFNVRQLSVADVNAYRDIRLEALRAFPASYGTTYGEAAAQPLSSFEKTFERGKLFGAFADEDLCGIASFQASTGKQSQHIGHVYQMYVRDTHQGKGLGIKLLEEIFDFAKDRVQQIYLGVGTKNLSALALYKKAGFEIYGTEPRALLVDGQFIDEHLMVKFIERKTT